MLAGAAMLAAGLQLAIPAVGALAIAGLVLFQLGRRDLALALLVVGLSVLPQALLLAIRPPDRVQDSVALVDAASRRLLAGHDPYGHDYIDDATLASFWVPEWPVNPLLAHLVYPPGTLVLGSAAHLAGLSVEWWWLPGTVALALAGRWAAGPLGVVATALNPAVLLDAFSLLNDLFFLAAALAAIALVDRRRMVLGGIALGAAIGLKQTAIVAVPLVAWLAWRRGGASWLGGAASAGLVTVGALLAPFLVWDAGAVVRDLASYFYGAGIEAFPIRGPGIPGWLLGSGIIASRWGAYPSALVQVALLIPIALSARWLLRRDSATGRYAFTALLVGALFFGGRTLAPNYVTVFSVFVLLSAASALDHGPPGSATVGGFDDRARRQPGVEGRA